MNAAIAGEKALYRSDRERLEASLMKRPIDSKKVFAYFGLMIGSIPLITTTVAISIRESANTARGEFIFPLLFLFAGLTSGVVGYFTGEHVPVQLRKLRGLSLPNRVAMQVFIGLVWGVISGAAGGVLIFGLGAIAGAFVGGFVGAITLPILSTFHELLRRGDSIELKHFLPIAFGITLTLCALILGAR